MKVPKRMGRVLLMFYQMVGSLVAKGGPWDGNSPQNREIGRRELDPPTMESVLGGLMANERYSIHQEGLLDIHRSPPLDQAS